MLRAVPAILQTRRYLGVILPVFASMFPGCRQPAQPTGAPAGSAPVTADRAIRVMLMDSIPGCDLSIPEEFEIYEAGTRNHLCDEPASAHLSARFVDGAIRLEEPDRMLTVRAVDLIPRTGRFIEIVTPKGARRFRGWMRLINRGGGSGAVINVVDIEDYLIGVVSAELPRKFHPEAFKAQAIAARTYAWYTRKTARTPRDWDVWSTESSQVYAGLHREEQVPQAVTAVRETAGLVCTWPAPEGERIFCTYFSSACGGTTQAAGPVKNEPVIPPLAGNVTCDYCRDSPEYHWGPVRLACTRITEQLRQKYPKFRSIGPIERMEVVERTPGGRPVRLGLYDGSGRGVELEAENFRLAVDPTGREIRSTFFTPVDEADAIVLTDGRGFGHGIGMCQYGADALARSGRSAAQILTFYYPGSHITRAY